MSAERQPVRLDDAAADRNRRMVAQGTAIVRAAEAERIAARLLGGAAVLVHHPDVEAAGGHRPLHDLDLLVDKGAQDRLVRLLVDRFGYRDDARFNAMHGSRRLILHADEWDLDLLVDPFEMCHVVAFGPRLTRTDVAIEVTDLLVTKLQIVEATDKDLADLRLLLGGGIGRLDADRLRALVRSDWGLWRTLTRSLDRVAATAGPGAAADTAEQVRALLDEAPKSSRWRLRAVVGQRAPWYVLPDESQ